MKKIIIFIVVLLIIVVGLMVIRIRNGVQTTTQSIKTEQNNAKDQQIKTDISNLQSALELYKADNNGNYPTSLSNLTPKYISTLPVNLYTSSAFTYTTTGSTYTLSTTLGDGTMYSQKNP